MELIVRHFKDTEGSVKPVIEYNGWYLYPIDDDACDRIVNTLLIDTRDFEGVTDYRIS